MDGGGDDVLHHHLTCNSHYYCSCHDHDDGNGGVDSFGSDGVGSMYEEAP